ncbi:hypothetical protein AS594_35740 [Streptomyces agglomeratus]|uniref:Uncharacterized protein n=1 Tax=Streptomyces agglomeratus TaxID=285458 RepID=A0A1E5PHH1_9ACTN|nr:hypothetical protein [Streptomyces agglomeratus]OEJ28979.1 hypothetical protein AS594_35740 [Streptomyces agglomeratus]
MTTARQPDPSVPGPQRRLLVWRDSSHFNQWQDKPCVLCDRPTPLRSHKGEAVHKVCAEDWNAAHPTEVRFVSDAEPKSRGKRDHA